MKSTLFFSPISILLFLMFFIFNPTLFSQVKIGDNPKSINSDAILEIESSNKGLLLTRVALKSTTTSSPLKLFTQGMVVYNTSTLNDVTPGLYYSDGKKWIKANTQLSSSDSNSEQAVFWATKGNNTVTSTNFIGSTNNAPVIIKTNNSERLRVTEAGWVGIGTSTPKASLQVKGQLIVDSLSLGSSTTDKILVANPTDGRVKYIPASGLTNGVQNYSEIVATSGKNIFSTPSTISDVNKIFLYRNGVLISFTVNNSNSIISEIPCKQGDQIRIIQLL
jgi:hypothetical protein